MRIFKEVLCHSPVIPGFNLYNAANVANLTSEIRGYLPNAIMLVQVIPTSPWRLLFSFS
jgi:hypothetical protein